VDVAAIQVFIDRRFPGHVFPEALTAVVARITGGVPLFMVSLLDELAGRGMLAERDGRWSLATSIEDVQAHRPASVRQLIDIQLDRLPAAEQRALEAAGVAGAEFRVSLVAAALGQSEEQVDDVCDALVRRSQFLRAEAADRYAFTHALIQEVCVERSSPARRQRWHRLIAEALERDPRAGDVSHLLAKHFDAAGEVARAVPAYAAAAAHAGQRYAMADALSLCARALDLLPELPPGRERDLLELDILRTLCRQVSSNSFRTSFAGREPLQVHTRAIEIARSLGDPVSLYGALTRLCNYNMIIARYAQCAELSAELEQIERAHELDAALLHGGVFARAYIAFFGADLATAIRLFERLAPPEDTDSVFDGNLAGRALALGHLACARWVVGDVERAMKDALSTIALADQIEVPILQALGHVVRGRLRYLRRDPLSIVEEESLHAVRAASLDVGLFTEASAFALWAEAQRGPLELGAIEPMLESLQRRLREVSTNSTLVALVLIDVLRSSGHAARARQLTDEIIAFATSHGEKVYQPELVRVRGEQVEDTDPAAAASDYRAAIELARAIGARSLELRAAESLAAMESR
jgi:adenylate cyclase